MKGGRGRPLPVVGISLGDPSGIGPEVVAKALGRPDVRRALTPVVFGDAGVLGRHVPLARWHRATPKTLGRVSVPTLCEVSELLARDVRPGKPSLAGGRAQLGYVDAAIQAAKAGLVDAVCTAPVSKEQITRAGVPFMGHTERFAAAFGCEVLMLMDGPRVRVALATNHLPLSQVSRALKPVRVARQLLLLSRSLRPLLRRAPRLAVLGVNPHAGEGGLLGREEVDVLVPAMAAARRGGVRVEGPFPADGLFARLQLGPLPYDAVLAMFHDQGLVAAKALDFERTVNVTLGLPVPRTSPDHGVAYDLAGKKKASAVPMTAALLKAAELANRGRR